MATAPAQNQPHHTHSHSNSNSFSSSHFNPTHNNNNNNSISHHRTPSFPANPLPLPLPLSNAPSSSPSSTKILLLSGFPPSLKTRDIQLLFSDFEHIGGGLKIKWRDDDSCFVVFADPPVAKRAYLALVASPPDGLKEAGGFRPRLEPYVGEDVGQIVASVAGRPRSRSVAGGVGVGGGVGHARRGSSQGGGGVGVSAGGAVGVVGAHQRQQSFGREGGGGGGVLGHAARGSRSSFGQQQLHQAMAGHPDELDESAIDEADGSVPAVPKVPVEHEGDKEEIEPKQVHNQGEKVDVDEAAAAVAGLALEA